MITRMFKEFFSSEGHQKWEGRQNWNQFFCSQFFLFMKRLPHLRSMSFQWFILLLFTSSCYADVLSLEDILQSVENYYPLIISAKIDQQKAEAEKFSSNGGFDPVLKASYMNNFGGYYKYNYSDISVEQPTPLWGTKIFAGWKTGQGNFPVYDAKMATFTGGEIRGGVEIPLLKGGLIDERRAKIQIAHQGIDYAYENTRSQLIEYQKQASLKYWDWVATGRKIKITDELLEISLQRDAGIAKKIVHGESAQIDQIDNHRSVLQRRSALVAAERAFQKASLELSLYFRDTHGAPLIPSVNQLPALFENQKFAEAVIKCEKSSAQILQHPELKKLQVQGNQYEIDYRLTSNQLLPKLDFQMGVFSDFGVNPGFQYISPSTYPTEFRAAFYFEFPLLLRSARGKAISTQLSIDRLDMVKQLTQNRLSVQITDSLQAMKAASQRFDLAQHEIELATKLEIAERRRAEHGDSSILIVNLREQATRDAMIKEVEAYSEFYKALAECQAASSNR